MGDLEKLFAARREIDRALVEQHSRDMAVLFTDIVGSTQFYETHGDIAGLALVRRHNDLLFPVVADHGGRVVKTVGDAIMAAFDDPPQAIRCAVQMQRVLAQANLDPESADIHIRAGAHAGRVMLDGDDLFGDAVNTAARIAHAADGDEVLVSRALFNRLDEGDRLVALPRDPLILKGKQEPMPVVAVLWQRDVHAVLADPDETATDQIFMLEVGLGSQGLRVAAVDGDADKNTVKVFGELPIQLDGLNALGERFRPFVRGKGSVPYTDQIRACGEALFQESLTERARKRLAGSAQRFLRLHVDDQLVHLPWELMHDGEAFTGLRFAVGRMVSARSDESMAWRRDAKPGHRALVVSNPSGDLPDAAREGTAVAELLRHGFGGEVVHLEGPVTREQLFEALIGCRLLHFAGHARRSSSGGPGGLQLADGVATAADMSERQGQLAPALVFANSCHASTADGWTEGARDVHSLASALLFRGTRHYLAPLWEVADDDALAFALRVYEHALAGTALGEAVRLARRSLEAPASFGGYVLYGDPRGLLVKTATATPLPRMRSSTKPSQPSLPGTPTTSSAEEVVDTSRIPHPAHPDRARTAAGQQRAGAAIAAAGVLLVALIAVGGWWLIAQEEPPPPSEQGSPSGREAAVETRSTPSPARPPIIPAPATSTGTIRLSILPFRNFTGDPALDFLSGGIAETLITDFGQSDRFRLIERGQIDVDIEEIEFGQSRYVDPATRAAIGKIVGAELVVLGGFQRAGGVVRATARVIHVETGEILQAVRVEQAQSKLFELQDKLASAVRGIAPQVVSKVRP